MPRFFFDLQLGEEDAPDASGVELADERTARREALARAAGALEATLGEVDACELDIQVREGDRRLFGVRVEASVTAADPRGDGIRPDQLNSRNDV